MEEKTPFPLEFPKDLVAGNYYVFNRQYMIFCDKDSKTKKMFPYIDLYIKDCKVREGHLYLSRKMRLATIEEIILFDSKRDKVATTPFNYSII